MHTLLSIINTGDGIKKRNVRVLVWKRYSQLSRFNTGSLAKKG